MKNCLYIIYSFWPIEHYLGIAYIKIWFHAPNVPTAKGKEKVLTDLIGGLESREGKTRSVGGVLVGVGGIAWNIVLVLR